MIHTPYRRHRRTDMLPKLSTLSAALDLGTFSINELSERAGVPKATVQTIVTRQRKEFPQWADAVRRRADGPGQPRLEFTLTAEGRAAIHTQLERWTTVTSFVMPRRSPATDDFKEPRGLRSAKRGLESLLAQRERGDPMRLVPHIKLGLRWARNELPAMTGEQAHIVEQQCAKVEAALEHWCAASVVSGVPELKDVPEIEGAFEDAERDERAIAATASGAIHVVPVGSSAGSSEIAQTAGHALEGIVDVTLKAMGSDAPRIDVATFPDRFGKIRGWYWSSRDLADLKVGMEVFCVDSSESSESVFSALQRRARTRDSRTYIVLDKSSSPRLKDACVQWELGYFEHASSELGWLGQAMAGVQLWVSYVRRGLQSSGGRRRMGRPATAGVIGYSEEVESYSASSLHERS